MFEDEYYDILGKARYGLGLTVKQLATRSGLNEAEIAALESGQQRPREAQLTAAAQALELAPGKLVDLALRPEPPRALQPSLPFTSMVLGSGFTSNGYLLACPATREGVIVDPGADPATIISRIEQLAMRPVMILLTHAHHDHIGALTKVRGKYPVPAVALKAELTLLGAHARQAVLVDAGHEVSAGTLRGRFLHVPGHTAGMATIVFSAIGVAFVGDALFARSLGRASGPGGPYAQLLENVRDKILSLPDSMILCPGHGPLTTVADEKRLNPFFP